MSVVKERSIILKMPQIHAILDGRQTQFRFPLAEQNEDATGIRCYNRRAGFWGWIYNHNSDRTCNQSVMCPRQGSAPHAVGECMPGGLICLAKMCCPWGDRGTKLWCKETWFDNYADRWDDSQVTHDPDGVPYILYRADGVPDVDGEEHGMPWRSAVHMPRWASRLTLEVVSVRVERLNQISEADAIAEGVEAWRDAWTRKEVAKQFLLAGARGLGEGVPVLVCLYAALWERIHGLGNWARNDWVWAVTFRRVET